MGRLQIFVQVSFLDKLLGKFTPSIELMDFEFVSGIQKLFTLLESRVDVHLDVSQDNWLAAIGRTPYYKQLLKKSQLSQLTFKFYESPADWKPDEGERNLILVDDFQTCSTDGSCYVVRAENWNDEFKQLFLAGEFSRRSDLFAFLRKIKFPSNEILVNDRFLFNTKDKEKHLLEWLNTSSSSPDFKVRVTTEVKSNIDLNQLADSLKKNAPKANITLADTREHNRCFISNFYFVVPGHGLTQEKDDFSVKSIFLPKNGDIGAAAEKNETAFEKYLKLRSQIVEEVDRKSRLQSVYTVYVTR